MRQVQLQQDEEQFAALIAEAEAGESLTILRGGKPVAQIIPFPAAKSTSTEETREQAFARLKVLMDKGFDMGGVWPGRAALYDSE